MSMGFLTGNSKMVSMPCGFPSLLVATSTGIFGKESMLGSAIVFIVLPTSSFDIWPHQIIDGFEYYDGSDFKLASSSDVTINDCKTAFKISFN